MRADKKSRDNQRARVNRQITAPEVRLINDKGENLGIVSIETALDAARAAELDLVEIAPNICRIMDYGKYHFNRKKEEAKARSKQRRSGPKLKEVKIRPTIEQGDYDVKLRNLIKFLQSGDKAKITMRFRGREITHREIGLKVFKRLAEDLMLVGDVEQKPKLEGRIMVMIMAPKIKKST